MKGVLLKIKSVFLWTVYLVIAHSMVHLTEASAGWQFYGATNLEMQTTVGGPNATDTITVWNTGTSSVNVTFSESIAWLVDIDPYATLTIKAGYVGTFTATASPAGRAAGTYYGTATISGGGISKQVPVTLKVTSSTAPVIGLSPTSLSFTGVAGGTNPAAKTLSITNTGGGTLSWSVSRNATWLNLSKLSGTGNGSVTVNVSIAGMAAGTYNTTITVAATGATTKSVPVTLTVAAQSSSATLTWSASSSTSVTGYKIYSKTGTGSYAPIAYLGKVTSYQATGLQKNTTYYFVVTAVDGAGNESIYSNPVYKTIY